MAELWEGIDRQQPADPSLWSTPSREASYERLTPQMWDALMQSAPQASPSLWSRPEQTANEAWAERTRRSVLPPGGRSEGATTRLLDAIGTGVYNAAASPSRLVNAQMEEYQPGVSVQDMPRTTALVPEVAMNVVGTPGITGGVPADALGMAAKSGPLWSPISDVKLRKPLAEMEHRYTDVRVPVPKIVNPEEMVGGNLVPTPWDLSATNLTATHIDNTKLPRPVVAQGGVGFPEANPGMAAASELAIARRLDNQAARLAETGKPTYIAPITMSPTGIDASHHVADPLSQLVQQAPIKRADATVFNELMRKEVPDWVSINSPKFQDYINNLKGGMTTKSLMAEKMALREWQNKGFPDVAAVRHAMSDPSLIDVPRNTSGMAISQYIPGQGLLDTSHLSYPKGVAGQHLGQWAHLAPFDVVYPDIAKPLAEYNAALKAAGKKTMIQPAYHLGRPTEGVPTHQELTNEWLDGLMRFFEMKDKGR